MAALDAWLGDGLLARGGPIVGVLVALSVAALAIALAKLHQFARARLGRRAALERALAALEAGDERAGRTLLARAPVPAARVVAAVLDGRAALPERALREEVERVGLAELADLEAGFKGLETIAALAPLLGLLGTVVGMIRAFMQLEAAGSRVSPALLAGGIWEALLTTAVGLGVAIPALAVLGWLESRVERARRDLGDAATRALLAGERVRRERAAPGAARAPDADASGASARAL